MPESAMASFIVAQAVSTVVRKVDEKYFGFFITKFQTWFAGSWRAADPGPSEILRSQVDTFFAD